VDREGLTLTRRPLLSIEASPPGGIVEGLAEPHKADGLTNRLRVITDRFATRRFERAKYNRRQRTLYHSRVPQATRDSRPNASREVHRTAPEKRLGTRFRKR
jgi:hypothetical protein